MPNVIEVVEQVKSNLPPRDVDGAIKLARELIDKLEIKEYPVPIIDILNELNINTYVSEMPSPNISGFIIIDKMKRTGEINKVVSVSETDEYTRQRFTYAHEFGHFLFDYGEHNLNHYFDTYNLIKTDKKEESVPSRFAAEFLMPSKMFEKRYKELLDSRHSEEYVINKLASEFEVGYKAVLKRLQELKLFHENEVCLNYVQQASV